MNIDPFAAIKQNYTLDEFVLTEMIGVTNFPTDLKRTAYALRIAKTISPETYATVRANALAGRAQWRVRATLLQRDWATKVSRRASKGRHHDSWSIREKYVRGCA